MSENFTLSAWNRLADKPGGKWLFSKIVCFKTPYFSTIQPRFIELRRGFSKVRMKKRRRVHNHIGTVHAIAVCNLAETAAGVMTDATMPPSHRWIPKGMTVDYLAKSETDLVAEAVIEPMPEFEGAFDIPVAVTVRDTGGQAVLTATITMYITPKGGRRESSDDDTSV